MNTKPMTRTEVQELSTELTDKMAADVFETNDDITEIISQALAKQKEHDYMTAVLLVKHHTVTWPTELDGQLWNERMTSLLNGLTVAFGFDGENE